MFCTITVLRDKKKNSIVVMFIMLFIKWKSPPIGQVGAFLINFFIGNDSIVNMFFSKSNFCPLTISTSSWKLQGIFSLGNVELKMCCILGNLRLFSLRCNACKYMLCAIKMKQVIKDLPKLPCVSLFTKNS